MENLGSWQDLVPALAFMVVLLGLFWWIVIRPARKRRKDHEDTIENVMAGDRVVTVGGLFGTIKHVEEDTIDLQVSENIILTLDRRAVRRHQDQQEAS